MKFCLITPLFLSLSLLALPLQSEAALLLGGLYETTTDVQNLLNLALDVAAMRETDDLALKQSIYQKGLSSNSVSSHSNVTLQSLSLNASDAMSEFPIFNIVQHAFLVLGKAVEGETEGFFDGNPIGQYGDTLVNDLFMLGIKNIETEAALVTSVWMACAHHLFQVMSECKDGDQAGSLAALDMFAALWIGAGQEYGSNDNGHMLYILAEIAGERFGQDNGQTMVNTVLLEHLLTLRTIITNQKCATTQGHRDMRPIIKKMIGIMTVPLVQNFIHHSVNLEDDGGARFVELYALATVPRVAACNPEAFDNELHLDVLRNLGSDQIQSAIESIQQAYDCLDVTCAQVGSYLGGMVPECNDESGITIAEYSTDREDARQKAYLDRDIKAIGIFLKFEAYEAAEDWYRFGWNSVYTLEDLATNQVVPSLPSGASSYLDTFQAYYKDSNFADSMITDILERVAPYSSATKEQIRNMMVGILQYVVVFATSASSLQYSIEMCSTDKTTALQFWDTGALLYIGSMEGPEGGGSLFGGELMFSTARDLCAEFNTCTVAATASDGVAIAAVNDVVMQGFKQVTDMIGSGSCDEAKGLLDQQILPTMIIPLIQGTIKYASYNAGLPVGTTDSSLAIGDTFAKGILPIVARNNQVNANIIAQNTAFQLSAQPVGSGFNTVAEALSDAISTMSTSCSDVGVFEDEPVDGEMCRDGTETEEIEVTDDAGEQEIAFGRFVFHSSQVAEQDASFALDVRDMFLAESLEDAESIYVRGSAARNESLFGETNITSLKSFSSYASKEMGDDPMFNIFRYALYDDVDVGNLPPEEFAFADNIISATFEQANDSKLSAEATVVMNIWMMIVHRLYEASRKCHEQKNPAGLIDSAVALWIGKGQKEGKFERGWGLYSVGQSAAEFYGLEEGEAQVNTDLMLLFNELQALGHVCYEGQDAAKKMHFKVHETIRTLAKPLILNLLFHMVSDSQNLMDLYAVAVVPQAVVCHETVTARLEAVLFSKSYSANDLTEGFLGDLATFLRCQRITPEDLNHSESVPEEFGDLLNALINRLTSNANGSTSLAGYDTKTDTSEFARLDLDIQEIKILTRMKAYGAAELVYRLGHHAHDQGMARYLPLQHLAVRTGVISDDLPRAIYSNYYNTQFAADDIITSALARSGNFVEASTLELADIVARTLQTMVTYDAIVDQMKHARKYCLNVLESQKSDPAAEHWDRAVAFFVGSMDGSLAASDKSGGGNFLFGLANSVCADFGTCEDSGVSQTSQELLTQFAAGRDAITSENCNSLQRVENAILPQLSAILIQSTLAFVLRNNILVSTDTIGSVYTLAKSVIPLVAKSNTTSGEILESTLGHFKALNTKRPVSQIVQAFAGALSDMRVDCEDIGVPVSDPLLSLCTSPSEVPNTLSTFVHDPSNLAKDVVDLQEALDSGSYEMAKLIYTGGKNAKVYDENGTFQRLTSLQSLSTNETLAMEDEPLFNIFKYSLQNEDGRFLSRDVRFYADSIVERTFTGLNEQDSMLPVEATVFLHLWMHIVHILYELLDDCKNQRISNGQGAHAMDTAMAYWIGDGQVGAVSNPGHLLYGMSEKAAENFQTGQDADPSPTNKNILKLFIAAKNEIAIPGACSDDPRSYAHLSNHVHKIVSLMTVPLMQNLIHSLRSNDRQRVELYSYAMIPLTASCNPATFSYLNDTLLHMKYTVEETEEVIGQLRNVYPCLGLMCNDVGIHQSEVSSPALQCKDPPALRSFAGYQPMQPVSNFAQLDLDLRQMDILLQMDAFDAAETLYTYGQHGSVEDDDGSLSLFQLASSQDRNLVPEFDAFVRYYDSVLEDPSSFADSIVQTAFDDPEQRWTTEQRRYIALKSMQVLVMYFGTLELLYEAVETCENDDPSDGQWDQGAAFWIGSLNGGPEIKTTTPSHTGYFYYDLAQEHCREFGTCQPDGSYVQVNERLLSLWYAGRGALSTGGCATARTIVRKISKLLLIPVIQGTLSSAVQMQRKSKATVDMDHAKAFVFSRVLVPLVASVNPHLAKVIEKQMGSPELVSTSPNANQVFSALSQVYAEMGIDCRLIGSIEGHDPCQTVNEPQSTAWLWILFVIVMLLLAFFLFTLYRRRRQIVKTMPENNPRFLVSETGELNHHSMDLLEKAFSTRSQRTGEQASLAEDDHFTDVSSLGDHESGSVSSSIRGRPLHII